jgi:hypothetical protein
MPFGGNGFGVDAFGGTRWTAVPGLIIATLLLSLSLGCGERSADRAVDSGEQAAEADARAAAETLEGNVERSARIMHDTYDADREAGEGRVDAAGDAYDAVLDEPLEEEEEEARKRAMER